MNATPVFRNIVSSSLPALCSLTTHVDSTFAYSRERSPLVIVLFKQFCPHAWWYIGDAVYIIPRVKRVTAVRVYGNVNVICKLN